MTAEQLIDKCHNEISPYKYGEIWKLHSGIDYSRMTTEMKKHWRWAVKDYAEYLRPLPPVSHFFKFNTLTNQTKP